jgi:hypothetical protein
MIRRLTITRVSYDGGQTWYEQPTQVEQVRPQSAYPPIGLTRFPLLFWPVLLPCVIVGWTIGFVLGLLLRLGAWAFRRNQEPVIIRRMILEEER